MHCLQRDRSSHEDSKNQIYLSRGETENWKPKEYANGKDIP
jgi:hypothetical protein